MKNSFPQSFGSLLGSKLREIWENEFRFNENFIKTFKILFQSQTFSIAQYIFFSSQPAVQIYNTSLLSLCCSFFSWCCYSLATNLFIRSWVLHLFLFLQFIYCWKVFAIIFHPNKIASIFHPNKFMLFHFILFIFFPLLNS